MERNKAIGIIKNHLPHDSFKMLREALETLIPELKESDIEDEKIRKALTTYFQSFPYQPLASVGINAKDALAWLEKQGGQNGSAKKTPASGALSFINYLDSHRYVGKMCVSNGECEDIVDAFHNGMWDKLHRYYCKYIEKQDGTPNEEQEPIAMIEPEFKEGDWVVFGNKVGLILGVQDDCYIGRDTDGWYFALNKLEENAHLWTIEDAKEGDVLYMNNGLSECVFIYELSNHGIINKHASYNKFGFERRSYLVLNDGYVIPATKEQRDTLFVKMQENGYEWDSQNNSLSKI